MTISIKTTDISNAIRGLSQTKHSGYVEGALQTGSKAAPFIPTRTYMASISGEFLFEVGAGQLDAVKHTRLLMQHAADMNKTMSAVAEEYMSLLAVLGYSREPFRKIIARIVGGADKPIRENAIPSVTPLAIHEAVVTVLPDGTHEVLAHMITDYVCHMLRPMGWIMADAPFVYCIRRVGFFPRYNDLVDVMEAKELQRCIMALADADLSLVKAAMERKSAILPSMTAQHLSNAVVMAYELARSTYDAQAIVRSVLTAVWHVNDCTLPIELQVKDRVRNHPAMSELRSNLAIILAVQDMLAQGIEAEISFSDEEMAAVVLPLFTQAMAEISPYQTRILEDVVGHVGKRSTRNHLGVPGHIAIYEDWDFSADVSAFVRIKQTALGKQSFLVPQANVTSALSSAMKPIKMALNMKALVDRRLTTYELAAASNRVPEGGTEMVLAFPSLTEVELQAGIPAGVVGSSLIAGDSQDDSLTALVYSRIEYDYYSMIVHLATARNGNVALANADTPNGSVPYIVWTVKTSLRQPIGDAAVLMGEVCTTEPLEVLAYTDDFSSVESRTARVLPIEDFTRSVHMWDWYGYSIPLVLEPAYPVTVRNNAYLVTIDEHEMLNLGVRRQNVRFIRPLMAVAIARIWMEWVMEDKAYIERELAASQDSLVVEGYKGRQVQGAMQLLNMLTAIGANGAGAYASKFVMKRLASQMYKTGNIDDYSDLHVGIQKHRMNVWSGLTTLQLLGLITLDDASDIVSYLAETDAMALVVGTVDLTYQS